MKQSIPFKGMTTAAVHEDGDARMLLNARNRNGVLQPVFNPEIIGPERLPRPEAFDRAYAHRTSEGEENYIFTRHAGGQCTVFHGDTPIEGAVLPENVNVIQATGNVVTLYTDARTFYMLYKDHGYVFLGEFPEMPDFRWDTVTEDYVDDRQMDLGLGFSHGPFTYGMVFDRLKELVRKAVNDRNGQLFPSGGERQRLFFDAFHLVLAFRLYDGSTVARKTGPFLVLPHGDIRTFKTADLRVEIGVHHSGDNIATTDYIVEGLNVKGFSLSLTVNRTGLGRWSDIIRSIDVFVSPPLGLTSLDNATVKDGLAFLDNDGDGIADIVQQTAGVSTNPGYQDPVGFPELYYADCSKDSGADVLHINGTPLVSEYSGRMMDSLKSASSFFRIRSIPVEADDESAFSLDFPSSDEDYATLYNLTAQEALTFENGEHGYGARKCYMYNGRNHLYGISKSLFKGFDGIKLRTPYSYNGEASSVASQAQPFHLTIVVSFDDGTKVCTTRQIPATPNATLGLPAFFSYPDASARKVDFYVSDQGNVIHSHASYDLVPHEYLDAAFLLNLKTAQAADRTKMRKAGRKYLSRIELQPVMPEAVILDPAEPGILAPEGALILPPPESVPVRETMKLKLTGLDNPFVYPNATTYSFDDDILAVCSNVIDSDSARFGDYDTYVFTRNMVLALKAGSGGTVYERRTVALNSNVPSGAACTTPYGVAFVLQDGIYLINGTRIKNLTEGIKEDSRNMRLYDHAGSPEDASGNPSVMACDYDMADYLAGVESIIYNEREGELIVVHNDRKSLIVGLDGSISVRDRTIVQKIGNTDRNYCVTNADTASRIVDLNHEDKGSRGGFQYFSRPMRFGDDDYKKVARFIVRGHFTGVRCDSDTKPSFWLLASLDGENFKRVRGAAFSQTSPEKPVNAIDVDFGPISINSRYYAVEVRLPGNTGTFEFHSMEADVSPSFRKIK